MFVRKTTHTNHKNAKTYFTYKLVESVRTERGPRQRTVLNLGSDFNTPQEQWKELADRIEQIVSGQTCLFPVPEQIEQAARRHAQQIIRRHGQRSPVPVEEQDQPDYQTVDLNSLESEQIRSVGGESVVLAAIRELGLDTKMEALGFNRPNIEAAIGVIAARLLAPASERASHVWLQRETALDDLLDAHFEPLSQDRVYKISDRLLRNKEEIENYRRDLIASDEFDEDAIKVMCSKLDTKPNRENRLLMLEFQNGEHRTVLSSGTVLDQKTPPPSEWDVATLFESLAFKVFKPVEA